MAYKVITHENGKFGLFETTMDRIVVYDATREEMVKYWQDRAAILAKREMNEWLDSAEGKEPAVFVSIVTFAEAYESHLFDNASCDGHRQLDKSLKKFHKEHPE